VFLLVLSSEWSIGMMLWQFTVPVLIGNMIGGTVLFAVLSYAQVKEEI
jgi:formate/nitrite transporter FocA (FNT family)